MKIKSQKGRFSEVFGGPLGDPLRGRFPVGDSRSCRPQSLNLSPNFRGFLLIFGSPGNYTALRRRRFSQKQQFSQTAEFCRNCRGFVAFLRTLSLRSICILKMTAGRNKNAS